MKCKFCSAELEEYMAFCPFCGKPQKEDEKKQKEEIVDEEDLEEELVDEELEDEEYDDEEYEDEEDDDEISTKDLLKLLTDRWARPFAKIGAWMKRAPGAVKEEVSTWKRGQQIMAGISTLLAFSVVTVAVLYACGINLLPRANDLFYNQSYSAGDFKAERKKEVVIATMGDQKLTNAELQAYYWFGVYDYVNQNGLNVGFNLSKPLDKQIYNTNTGMTYQQLFLQQAIESWRRYAVLVQMANENNFKLTQEQQNYMNSFESQIVANATQQGYSDAQKFLDEKLFPGFSVEAYAKYQQMNYFAMCYYDVLYEEWMPDELELDAFYTKHKQEFVSSGIDKSAGSYYDVRYMLIATDGSSDEDWDACKNEAQRILDLFLAGEQTDERFAEFVATYSEDTTSASAGGLETQLTKYDTKHASTFKNWFMDENRKPGDTGIVQNTETGTQGYYIIYFISGTPIWEYEATLQILSESTMNMLEDARKTWPITVNYKKVVLGKADLLY